MTKKRIAVVVFTLLCVFLVSVFVSAQSQQPVLANPDFEQGFTVREAPEVRVAVGWDYAYLQGDDRWCTAPCNRPEFTEESGIVYTGDYSQRWFATFARQFGVIHQSVVVESGQWYEFSCQIYAISEPNGQQAVFAGVNPWNAGVFERTMIWGQQQPWDGYREWYRVSVTAQAWGDRIRVAVGSNNNWPTKNNAAYVDNCQIRKMDIAGPTITPCPTCIPGPGDCASVADVATVIAEWDRR